MVIFGCAWWGYYRLSKILFVLFLCAFVLVFWHHVSDVIGINL
jgi:hypothetical protein